MKIGELEIKVTINEIQIFIPFSELNNGIFYSHNGKFENGSWHFINNQLIWDMIDKLFGITPKMTEVVKIEFDLSDLRDDQEVLLEGYVLASRRNGDEYPTLYCDLISGNVTFMRESSDNASVSTIEDTIIQAEVCKGILGKIGDLIKFKIVKEEPKIILFDCDPLSEKQILQQKIEKMQSKLTVLMEKLSELEN